MMVKVAEGVYTDSTSQEVQEMLVGPVWDGPYWNPIENKWEH